MKHIPDILLLALALMIGYIGYLHWTDGGQPRGSLTQADVLRLQITNQTATAQAKKEALKGRRR